MPELVEQFTDDDNDNDADDNLPAHYPQTKD